MPTGGGREKFRSGKRPKLGFLPLRNFSLLLPRNEPESTSGAQTRPSCKEQNEFNLLCKSVDTKITS